MSIKQELAIMLKEGWNFYKACYRLGITPKEGSNLLRNKKQRKQKSTSKVNYTWCGNYHCRYCSDNNCNLRKEEME